MKERKSVLLRLPPWLHEWLREEAEKQSSEIRQISVNSIIIEAIMLYRLGKKI